MKIELNKRAFTCYELETIAALKSAEDFNETIKTMLDVVKSDGELLNVSAYWTYNRVCPSSTFFGDGLDIVIKAYVLKYDTIHYICADLKDINNISTEDDWNELGYHKVYTRN